MSIWLLRKFFFVICRNHWNVLKGRKGFKLLMLFLKVGCKLYDDFFENENLEIAHITVLAIAQLMMRWQQSLRINICLHFRYLNSIQCSYILQYICFVNSLTLSCYRFPQGAFYIGSLLVQSYVASNKSMQRVDCKKTSLLSDFHCASLLLLFSFQAKSSDFL